MRTDNPDGSNPNEPSPVLARNLAALIRVAPRAARAIAEAEPIQLEWVDTPEGPSAVLNGRALASKRRPMEEGRTVASNLDVTGCGVGVCLGFGLGYHARALAERFDGSGLVIAVEPDVGLLRAVFDRIDHSAWIAGGKFTLLTDTADPASINELTNRIEGLIAVGVKFAEHPADRVRLAGSLTEFHDRFQQVIRAVRGQVLTTLMQVDTTVRNLLMNADHYVKAPGVQRYAGVLKGRPAVVVSAGPSFHRNAKLLARPGVRDRVCIIAVQTTLKPLLAMGIKPHFVVALDYAEISKRFYEGLTKRDVEGVTLVAEAKANPAILDAFPGRVVCVGNDTIDLVLGDGLVRGSNEPGRTLNPGATVAHLATYLARHMGCDPLILIGQDLGFTDGQYYAAGASIHQVWSGELNSFRSLEMLEWERIARQGSLLHKAEDVYGRPIYTDEQMSGYLVQFQQDFQRDAEAGLRTIDATEGGVRKAHAEPIPLADALASIDRGPETIGDLLPSPEPGDAPSIGSVIDRLESLAAEVRRIESIAEETGATLGRMLDHHDDQKKVNKLIGQVDALRDKAQSISPAFELVQFLNQTGTLNRYKADRSLHLDKDLPPLERQRAQIERDRQNVSWIAGAARQLASMLADAARSHRGEQPKVTKEAAPETALSVESEHRPVLAVIPVDADRSGLGTLRGLRDQLVLGENPLRLTLRRLARSKELDGAVLLAANPAEASSIAGIAESGGEIDGLRVDIHRTDGHPMCERRGPIGQARLSAQNSWRGGIGQLSVFDEVFEPAHALQLMQERSLGAVVAVGCDWALVDPMLLDRVIGHHREHPESRQLVFSHAACGFGALLAGPKTAADLVARRDSGGPFATVGGMLGYAPLGPLPDLIGRSNCVAAEPVARDLGLRVIPDTPQRRAVIAGVLEDLDDDWLDMGSAELAELLSDRLRSMAGPVPLELTLELCVGRATSGVRADWLRRGEDVIERPAMDTALARRLVTELADGRPNACLHLAGLGDPLLHPGVCELIAHAKESGVPFVHVRTDLQDESIGMAALEAGADAISVDLMARDAQTYRTMMGVDAYDRVSRAVRTLADARPLVGGLPSPWIVPRITRCDAVYEHIEMFYGEWLSVAGAAVIDPAPIGDPKQLAGQRIQPLPAPATTRARFRRERMTVLSDGSAPARADDLICASPLGSARTTSLTDLWSMVQRGRPEPVLMGAA